MEEKTSIENSKKEGATEIIPKEGDNKQDSVVSEDTAEENITEEKPDAVVSEGKAEENVTEENPMLLYQKTKQKKM